MSALTAVVRIGSRPPLGGGIEVSHVAHCYGTEWPRFVIYAVRPTDDGGPDLQRLPGSYAPVLGPNSGAERERPSPLTDLLLVTAPERSTVSGLLDTLDTKAKANYGVTFREKVLASDVSRGSPGYGRLFEARSQLESHPYDGAIVVGFQTGCPSALRDGLVANAARLDADIEMLDVTTGRRTER